MSHEGVPRSFSSSCRRLQDGVATAQANMAVLTPSDEATIFVALPADLLVGEREKRGGQALLSTVMVKGIGSVVDRGMSLSFGTR